MFLILLSIHRISYCFKIKNSPVHFNLKMTAADTIIVAISNPVAVPTIDAKICSSPPGVAVDEGSMYVFSNCAVVLVCTAISKQQQIMFYIRLLANPA